MAIAAKTPITMPAIAPPEIEDEEPLLAVAEFVDVAVEVGVDDVDVEMVIEVELELEVELDADVVGVGVEVETDAEEESDSEYIWTPWNVVLAFLLQALQERPPLSLHEES
jgi:hypothetical protein